MPPPSSKSKRSPLPAAIDKLSNLCYKCTISIGKSISEQDTATADDLSSAKAIRTAGSNAANRSKRLATSVALLIELKAQVL